jgi:iron complex outermembrane receptor protein
MRMRSSTYGVNSSPFVSRRVSTVLGYGLITRRGIGVLLSACALFIGLSLPSSHAGAAESSGASSSGPELEEVIVTARKHDESLVNAPESINVFSEKQIEDLHIENFVDYVTKAPNVSFAYGVTFIGFFSRSIAIRGISGPNTTAIYIDDTPISQAFDPRVLDIDRIEVLKGPQGSLFGADSMGGAIRLISNKPDTSNNSYREMVEGGLTSGGGSPDYGFQSAANLVVIPDVMATRAVVFYHHDAGFLTRTNPVPGDPSKLEETPDQGATTNYGFALTTLAHVIPNLDVTLRVFNQTTNLPKGWTATLAPLPAFEPTSYNRYQPTDLQDDAYTQVWLPSLQMTYQQKQWSITSATSFFDLHDHETESSQVGTDQAFENFFGVMPPPNVPPWNQQDHQWQFIQELRAGFQDLYRFSGVVGLYYSNQHIDTRYPPLIYPGLTGLGIGATSNLFYVGNQLYHNTETAAFGELNYHLNDRITLTAGGREYRLANATYIADDGFINGGLTIAAPLTQVNKGFSPKFAIASTVGSGGNIYASWAKGFRPGGGNQFLPPACDGALAAVGLTPQESLTYHPDSVKTTEVGAKGESSDHRLFASGAAFQTDWNGVQQEVNLPACGYQTITNAGAGRIRGGEIQLNAKVISGFDVSFGAGYQDARVTEAGGSAFIVGERLLEVPEVTATVNGTYRFPIAGDMGGIVSGDVSYTGNSLSGNTTPATPLTRPAYTLANARVGVEWPRSSLILYVNNIGNEHANLADLRFIGFNETTVNSAGQTVPLPRVVVLPPIQAGLQYRVNF